MGRPVEMIELFLISVMGINRLTLERSMIMAVLEITQYIFLCYYYNYFPGLQKALIQIIYNYKSQIFFT